jgi:hypothetical protein
MKVQSKGHNAATRLKASGRNPEGITRQCASSLSAFELARAERKVLTLLDHSLGSELWTRL